MTTIVDPRTLITLTPVGHLAYFFHAKDMGGDTGERHHRNSGHPFSREPAPGEGTATSCSILSDAGYHLLSGAACGNTVFDSHPGMENQAMASRQARNADDALASR